MQAVAVDADVGQDGRVLRRLEHLDAGLDRLGQGRRIAAVGRPRQRRRRRRHPGGGDVGRQRDVDRLLAHQADGEDPVDLGRRVLRRQIGLRRRHPLVHAPEDGEVAGAERVMDQRAGSLGGGGGSAGDRHHRHVFGKGAGDAVDGAELAHAEGGRQRREALDAAVAVGGVGGVQLVAGADPGDVGMRHDLVEEAEVVVARQAEDVADAEFGQAVQQVLADRHPGHGAALVRLKRQTDYTWRRARPAAMHELKERGPP